MAVRAGEMRERVTILTPTEKAGKKGCEWTETKTTWAKVEKTGKRSLFSTVGAGREEWRVTMRKQPLTLHQALRWRGHFLFLSDLTYPDRGHMEVSTALIEPVTGTVRRTKVEKNALNNPSLTTEQVLSFPVCLTEKYVGFTQGDTHDTTTLTYVAICPKAVQLHAGEVVTLGEDKFRVQFEHELSEFKNEYEITREADT